MRIGLFGFPLTGKSTLFRLLTGAEAPARAGRGEVQIGVTKVPDPRLDRLAEMYSPKRVVPATIEYLDLAGVGKGEAADALPLDQLRLADALAHVVRGFKDEAVPHAEGEIDPAQDAATMETELILADHTIAQRRIDKLAPLVMKANRDEDRQELEILRKALGYLEQDIPLRNVDFTEQERFCLRGFTFLSLKPLLIVVNADESDASRLDEGAAAFGLDEFTGNPSTYVVALSAKIEDEIARLRAEDAAAFRENLGIREPALDKMIRASYDLLGRISFFTVGEDECRAWRVRRATPARTAARAIHSDIEKGFIRAEVVAYEALIDAGNWNTAKERGTLRLEGKEYEIKDGDISHFRFNV
jgi:GTP-binding protein YchF